MTRIERPPNLNCKGEVVSEPKKRLFKITRTRKETALKVAFHKETIADILENAPGIFPWEHDPTDDMVEIEEIPMKKTD